MATSPPPQPPSTKPVTSTEEEDDDENKRAPQLPPGSSPLFHCSSTVRSTVVDGGGGCFCCCCCWNSDEWEYLAEGGRHVLFARRRRRRRHSNNRCGDGRGGGSQNCSEEDETNTDFHGEGWLLRWNKQDLMDCAAAAQDSCSLDNHSSLDTYPTQQERILVGCSASAHASTPCCFCCSCSCHKQELHSSNSPPKASDCCDTNEVAKGSDFQQLQPQSSSHDHPPPSLPSPLNYYSYIQNIVQPSLAPYVDLPLTTMTWTMPIRLDRSNNNHNNSDDASTTTISPVNIALSSCGRCGGGGSVGCWKCGCALGSALYHGAIQSGKIPWHRRKASWHWPSNSSSTTTTTPTSDPIKHEQQQKVVDDTTDTTTNTSRSSTNTRLLPKDAVSATNQQYEYKRITVALIRDYRYPFLLVDKRNQLHPKTHNAKDDSRSYFWSVELKPKAGYRPFSPLIHPDRRIKYTASRFQLLRQQQRQQQQQQTQASKALKTAAHAPPSHCESRLQEPNQPQPTQTLNNNNNNNKCKSNRNPMDHAASSAYDPLLLFSKDPEQIREALQSLMKFPSNNLRLWRTPVQKPFLCKDNHKEEEEDSTTINSQQSHVFSAGQNHPPHPQQVVWSPPTRPSGDMACGDQDATTMEKELKNKETTDCRATNNNDDDDDHDDEAAPLDFITSVLTQVLFREPFLSRLLSLQELDWLDADGAILLYHHLLSLLASLPNSLASASTLEPATAAAATTTTTKTTTAAAVELAHALVDQLHGNSSSKLHPVAPLLNKLNSPNDATRKNENLPTGQSDVAADDQSRALAAAQELIQNCPIPFPHHLTMLQPSSPSSNMYELLTYIQEFKAKIQEQNMNRERSFFKKNEEQVKEELDAAYKVCTDLIHTLSIPEAVYLLQVWLLSLAMCDVSFFVRLHIFHDEDGDKAGVGAVSGDDDKTSNEFHQLQTQDEPGWLHYHHSANNSNVFCSIERKQDHRVTLSEMAKPGGTSWWWIAYSIKVIDCDAKPAHKLASRQSKENLYKGMNKFVPE